MLPRPANFNVDGKVQPTSFAKTGVYFWRGNPLTTTHIPSTLKLGVRGDHGMLCGGTLKTSVMFDQFQNRAGMGRVFLSDGVE